MSLPPTGGAAVVSVTRRVYGVPRPGHQHGYFVRSVPASDDRWRDYLEKGEPHLKYRRLVVVGLDAGLERRSLQLKGKEQPFEVVVVRADTPVS